ncbi:MAG: hypothetical protein Q8L06_12405 [Pseudohongiella sp.]|nr:hypothetical protein [Pseudohongiella sp.]
MTASRLRSPKLNLQSMLSAALLMALLTLLLVWVLATQSTSAGNSVFITNAQQLSADFDGHAATAPEQHWRSISLPRSWSRDELHPAQSADAWYRVALPEQARDAQWNHLLMLRHMMNVEVWLDQHYLGSAGPVMPGVLQRNWNRPFVWVIPEDWLSGDGHMLYFRLHSAPDFGVMSPFLLGTEQAIQSRYQLNYFLQIDLVKISLLAMLFIGCLSVFVWIRNRQHNWLFTALMSMSWSLPLLYILLPSVPIAEFNFLRISHWGTVTGAFCLLAFIYAHYLKVSLERLKWLGLLPVIHGILLAFSPDQQVVYIGSAGQLLAQTLFVVLIVQLLARPALRNSEVFSIVAGLLVMLLAAAHDVSLAVSSSIERWRWDMFLSYITQPLMMILISWHGIRALMTARDELNALNALLQLRLQAAEKEISEVFEQQAQLEREIHLSAERELVYRDLHDDLGARLLSLVFKSEQGPARDLARSALQDLRDIVSRVLSAEQRLFAVLADSMAEHEGRAAALKKQFNWDIDNLLEDISCDSRLVLGLRLLLRELLGNCLRSVDIQSLNFAAKLICSDQLMMTLRCDPAVAIPMPPLLRKRLAVLNATLESFDESGAATQKTHSQLIRVTLTLTAMSPSASAVAS